MAPRPRPCADRARSSWPATRKTARYANRTNVGCNAEQDVRHVGARPGLQQRQHADDRNRQQRVALSRRPVSAMALEPGRRARRSRDDQRIDEHRESDELHPEIKDRQLRDGARQNAGSASRSVSHVLGQQRVERGKRQREPIRVFHQRVVDPALVQVRACARRDQTDQRRHDRNGDAGDEERAAASTGRASRVSSRRARDAHIVSSSPAAM